MTSQNAARKGAAFVFVATFTSGRAPDNLNGISFELTVCRKNWHIFCYGLCDQHTVEWVRVMTRQFKDFHAVKMSDWQGD